MYFAPRNYWAKGYWPRGYWPNLTPETVELDLLDVTGGVLSLAVVPGTATVALGAASLAALAEVVSAFGGEMSISLGVLGMTGAVGDVVISMVVPLQPVGMTAEMYRLIVFTLLGCAIASVRGRAEATISARATAFAVLNDRTGCQ